MADYISLLSKLKAPSVIKHHFDLRASTAVRRIPDKAQVVLLGEATHGTLEFYETRAELSKLLIEERGFHAVVLEADFPDAFRANLWARGLSQDTGAEQALLDFKWLRNRNLGLHEKEQRLKGVGLYGLDLYSLNSSTETVINYLKGFDVEAAHAAMDRYSCISRHSDDIKRYGAALAEGYRSCEDGVIEELLHTRSMAAARRRKSEGQLAAEEWDFAGVANAQVVKHAEAYYRTIFFGDSAAWSVRDQHMADTIESLIDHLQQRGIQQPKIVVWAHNSHVGDARATEMGRSRGELSLGQLCRERFGRDDPDRVFSIGFSTHTGHVAAAPEWGKPVRHMKLQPSMAGSYEQVMHVAAAQAPASFGLDFRAIKCSGRDMPVAGNSAGADGSSLLQALKGPMLQRAIGATYRPERERGAHYLQAWLPDQFDMLLHADVTRAILPLDVGPDWITVQEPAS